MLVDGLERIEAERGIEAIRLIASATAPLADRQLSIGSDEPSRVLVSELVDRLTTRAVSVWRASIDPNRPPESCVVATSSADILPATARETYEVTSALAGVPPRPARLLDPPEPIMVTGLLPDVPPVQFIWRRQRHKVVRADGPERLYRRRPSPNGPTTALRPDRPEYPDAASMAVRDYYTVEDEAGRRFWLMREGDGVHLDTGNLSWYLQGLF